MRWRVGGRHIRIHAKSELSELPTAQFLPLCQSHYPFPTEIVAKPTTTSLLLQVSQYYRLPSSFIAVYFQGVRGGGGGSGTIVPSFLTPSSSPFMRHGSSSSWSSTHSRSASSPSSLRRSSILQFRSRDLATVRPFRIFLFQHYCLAEFHQCAPRLLAIYNSAYQRGHLQIQSHNVGEYPFVLSPSFILSECVLC